MPLVLQLSEDKGRLAAVADLGGPKIQGKVQEEGLLLWWRKQQNETTHPVLGERHPGKEPRAGAGAWGADPEHMARGWSSTGAGRGVQVARGLRFLIRIT